MMTNKNTATTVAAPETQPEMPRKHNTPPRLLAKETVLDNLSPAPIPKKYDLTSFSHRKLILWASYRVPMKVVEGVIVPFYSSKTIYYLCPRCLVSIEQEYTLFCNHCGQKLDWRGHRKATLRHAGEAFSLESQSKKHIL